MRKARYAVATFAQIEADTGLVVRVGDGGECALFLHEGRCYAVGSLSPHKNASLAGAPVVDGHVVCRRHGYRFDLGTGDCITLAGYGLPTFQTEIVDDTVFVTCWEFD